jgi:hypothetical protein
MASSIAIHLLAEAGWGGHHHALAHRKFATHQGRTPPRAPRFLLLVVLPTRTIP